ncbi:hypothetical protein Q7P37_000676 [Cladosporium fusiforme]
MSPVPSPILLTGTTGGLGTTILHHLLHTHHLDPKTIIATSRSPAAREKYESQGVQFRELDYARPETLRTALEGVGLLLFVSSSERDTPKRNAEHGNVVDAAVKAGVREVWYVSLAFGGFGDGSEIGFMQAHLWTEARLRDSGLRFLSLRAGIYTDAFPLFLNWYPSSAKVLLPDMQPPVSQGRVAFTSRDELGEGIAILLAKGLEAYPSIIPKTDKNIILLTSLETDTLEDLVRAISRARGKYLPVEYLEPNVWIEESTKDDEGCKPRAWFEARLAVLYGFNKGDGEDVDGALAALLGRNPERGADGVERLVREDPEYRWHQNHMQKAA